MKPKSDEDESHPGRRPLIRAEADSGEDGQ
jgi:hypothetical protein